MISNISENELTKVEKGIYSVAKREEVARTQSMSALLEILLEIKEENNQLYTQLIEQDKMLTKLQVKKDYDNTNKIVNSNEKLAVLIAKMATSNAKSQNEAIEILNDICKELETKGNSANSMTNDYSHLRVMR